jgi:hypothetical protein
MQAIRLVTLFLALLSVRRARRHTPISTTRPAGRQHVEIRAERGACGSPRRWSRATTRRQRSSTGAVVASGGVDPADPKQMVIQLHGLPPGKYKVF